MSRERIANISVLCGVISLTAAGWWIHPALALAVAGILAIAVGVGIIRSKT